MGLFQKDLEPLRERWMAQWPRALNAWSRFTKLSPPRLLTSGSEEKKEGLTGSFAMIRLVDHAVVISLLQVEDLGLQDFGTEIMAHEIGHHVYAPADLKDNAMLIARIRVCLPTKESMSGFVSNLYTDLLINNRLQRQEGLDMAGVYKKLQQKDAGDLWSIYMMIYENLWGLPPGSLTPKVDNPRMVTDAGLGARVIRAYSKDWLDGAGRFALLIAPYLPKDSSTLRLRVFFPMMDADNAGAGGEIPDGMAEVDEGELEGAIHPADDPEITGLSEDEDEGEEGATAPNAGGRAIKGGKKNNYRSPAEYTALMKSVMTKVSEDDLIIRYYRERALPYLIRFPSKDAPTGGDPLPEGLDLWDVGDPFGDLDWVETMVRSPVVIPGVNTLQRTYGYSPGASPDKAPPDMYIGIDCSGSMMNPKFGLSYPCLAGVIVAISALRAGARVMACLSGESPGKYTQTDGFIRDEKKILSLLTGYLGTGYSFGVERLRETFLTKKENKRPAHILVISDQDMFHMLEAVKDGWEVIAQAILAGKAGGTFLLNIVYDRGLKFNSMREAGWNIHLVNNQEQMLEFARKFSRQIYDKPSAKGAGKE